MTCWYYRLPGHLDTYGPVLGMWKTADDFQDHLRTLWGTALPTGLEIWKGGIRPTRVAVV